MSSTTDTARDSRRLFLQRFAAAAALAPTLLRTAGAAEGRVNPPAILELEAGNYRFLPAGGVFCGGVMPHEGYEVVHAILRPSLPLTEGYAFVQSYLSGIGRPIQALCGMELRAPAQMTFEAFRAFNLPYVEQLRKWELTSGVYSAVCRTNVVPAIDPPKDARLHAFSYVAPDRGNLATFLVSGAADIDPRGKIVADGDTSPAGMKKRIEFVIQAIGNRMAEMQLEWNAASMVDLYLVADIPDLWGSTILPALGKAAMPGVRLHYARPPIVGAEVELEARAAGQELMLATS